MAAYVLLIKWTDQGMRQVRDSPNRLDKAKAALRDMGGQFSELCGASTKLAKKCQGQGSNREARCADRLLNEIRNIAFADRVDNEVCASHSTI